MAAQDSKVLPPGTQDLTGQRFGKWLVLSYVGPSKQGSLWSCHCDCGTDRTVKSAFLRKGLSKSCGCRVPKHGMSGSPEYYVWNSMHGRCSPTATAQMRRNYFDRGIGVCEEWTGVGGFIAFFAHVGKRPTPDHTLDRIDNDGNYRPGNVRWATMKEQALNRGCTYLITADGVTDSITGWAKRLKIPYTTLYQRIKSGMSFEEARNKAPLYLGKKHGNSKRK